MKNDTLAIIIVVVFICVMTLYIYRVNKKIHTIPLFHHDTLYSPYCDVHDIPKYLQKTSSTKVIWSYWNSQKLPNSVCLAFQTWKYQQPDFIICLLSEDTLSNFIDIHEVGVAKSHQERADMIRLVLLEKYGGYWVDATIYFQKPIAVLWEPKDYDIGGYWIDGMTTDLEHKVFENWFIVAPKNSPLIREWKREFFEALRYENRQIYIDKIQRDGVDLQKITLHKYLMMHCCYLKVTRGKHSYRIKNISVTDEKEGPFYYLATLHQWNSKHSIFNLLNYNDPRIQQTLLKLRGEERLQLDYNWKTCKPFSKIAQLRQMQ
jgi:hypothetical protein